MAQDIQAPAASLERSCNSLGQCGVDSNDVKMLQHLARFSKTLTEDLIRLLNDLDPHATDDKAWTKLQEGIKILRKKSEIDRLGKSLTALRGQIDSRIIQILV